MDTAADFSNRSHELPSSSPTIGVSSWPLDAWRGQKGYLGLYVTIAHTMEFAWKSFVEPDPESEFQGVVGHLNLSGYRTVPKVLWYTRAIEAQLAESDGLVGYALRAKLAQKKFWAVAAWERDESLQNYVESDPHAGIRVALKPEMKESWFKRFDVQGEEVPLGIDEALERVRM